ncbi:MAG TPA: hypothetical protein PKA95_18155 [Thermomicrobiales bacterium]|nr:hypothetical protein [Thermomicrobiales bacterium]
MRVNRLAEWFRENAWAIVALTVPWLGAILAGEALLLFVPVALAVGYLLQPRQLWPLWLWTLAVIWVVNAIAAVVDPESMRESGETAGSFFFESLLFMAALVLLPLWLGRFVARALDRRRAA